MTYYDLKRTNKQNKRKENEFYQPNFGEKVIFFFDMSEYMSQWSMSSQNIIY